MWYIYILKSRKRKNWVYAGSTNNLKRRITEHKSGLSAAVKNFLPIYLVSYISRKNRKKFQILKKIFEKGLRKSYTKKKII